MQPTDWALLAFQSLVERYGCIAGYPNSIYRGNRAITRYEFAAGLNACLSRINELIATATSDLVTKEDLTSLQRLQEYALGLAFPDLGKQGNLGGVLVGAEPYRGGNPAPANDLSLHIEGFYKYQLTDNIAITPGVIWITAPAQNNDNQDAVIGTVRTTFTF